MATTPHTPTHTTPPHDAASPPRDVPSRDPSQKQTMRESFKQKQKEAADAFQAVDDIRFRRATEGVTNDPDMRDRVLAMGGDATRSSPDPAQPLDDAVPGFTTTTGVHRTPMDPTTAAVPADPESELVEKMRGAPTVGSGRQHDTPEKLWAEPEAAGARKERGLPGGRPV